MKEQKTSRLYGVTKLRNRDEKSSRDTTPNYSAIAKSLINSALSSFINYPMITEEAGFPLSQKPPCPVFITGRIKPTP